MLEIIHRWVTGIPVKFYSKIKVNTFGRKILNFPKGTIVEYKITQGSWNNEATDENGLPFSNTVFKVTQNDTNTSTINFWKSGDNFEILGQITGTVQYHKNLQADTLLPRDVIVWLPPGYSEQPTQRYPVLYMHDGQNIFDPNTAAFKVDWQVDETADSLIRNEKITPLIIVGIYNTAHRSNEFGDTDEGFLYRKFVMETVKPLIDKTYRTKTEAEYTAVGGSSAGGLVSFILAWENPEVFSKALCMSPAFKIAHIDYVKNVQKYNGIKKDITFYIDNGGVGLEERLQPGVDAMLKALNGKGYKQSKDYFWVMDSTAKHNEAAWAQRMPKALKLVFGSQKP